MTTEQVDSLTVSLVTCEEVHVLEHLPTTKLSRIFGVGRKVSRLASMPEDELRKKYFDHGEIITFDGRDGQTILAGLELAMREIDWTSPEGQVAGEGLSRVVMRAVDTIPPEVRVI